MSAERWSRIEAAARIGLATLLGAQSLAFLVAGRAAFARLGYPDAARVALGSVELAAAVLVAIPRTFFAGAVGLIASLSWAAGFHFALRARGWPLLADIVLVALLMVARSPARERGRTTA